MKRFKKSIFFAFGPYMQVNRLKPEWKECFVNDE